jgi:hypothetical protein
MRHSNRPSRAGCLFRMSTSEDFLAAARTLARADSAGLGHFRRAISTAYYAAFHATVEACAGVLFASVLAVEESRAWFEHGKLADVARALGTAPGDSRQFNSDLRAMGLASGPSAELRQFGQLLRWLYDQRQLADYFGQPALALGRVDAERAIVNAELVCSQLSLWTATGDEEFERMALAMLSKSVGAKKR